MVVLEVEVAEGGEVGEVEGDGAHERVGAEAEDAEAREAGDGGRIFES